MTRRFLLLGAVLVMAGCATRTPPPALWHLDPVTPMPASWQAEAPSVYVAAVRVPRYVDRPEVMQRAGPSRLDAAALHRWAEPLDRSVTRVLGEDLARRLASQRIFTYPEEPRLAVDYRVWVEVVRLDGQVGDALHLVARWSLADGATGAVLAASREDVAVPAGDSMASFVAAHAQALDEVAASIAAAVRRAGEPAGD